MYRKQSGSTALHWAVSKDHTNIVHHLLGAGASSHIKNVHGKTAADLAAELGKGKSLSLVLALFFLSHKSAFFYPALLFFISSLISGDLLDSRYLLLFSILAWADRSNAIFTKKKVVKNK